MRATGKKLNHNNNNNTNNNKKTSRIKRVTTCMAKKVTMYMDRTILIPIHIKNRRSLNVETTLNNKELCVYKTTEPSINVESV